MNKESTENILRRPLTWFEEQMLRNPILIQQQTDEFVKQAIAKIKADICAKINDKQNISVSFDLNSANNFIRQFVESKLIEELRKLGLNTARGASWTNELIITPAWQQEDLRILLKHSWGEITQEECDKALEPFLKNRKKKDDVSK